MPTFISHRYNETPQELPSSPYFTLIKDSWNDFGIRTLYELYYIDAGEKRHAIGPVKILHGDDSVTSLPTKFTELDPNHITLGQSVSFYAELLGVCGQDLAIKVLEALRDISWSPNCAERFEKRTTFRNSLLRENKAAIARQKGRSIILREEILATAPDDVSSFEYNGCIPGADAPTKVRINFNHKDPVPGRIVGIIGRNATGKTQYLAQLAKDLTHNLRLSDARYNETRDRFGERVPLFNRVITLSYSVFDKFQRPEKSSKSYVYCGIRNQKGGVSHIDLSGAYEKNCARIKEMERESAWREYMKFIMKEHGCVTQSDLRQTEETELNDDELSPLSSGQAILRNLIAALLAWIEPFSLVVFDEPETHLHPNAVAGLFQVLNSILNEHNSFCLLATHSPLVIQELPSKRVIIFEREGNVTEAKYLPVETFGENLSELTRHVFETHEVPSYYKRVLRELSGCMPYEKVNELFPEGLSMNAQSYLLSRYPEGLDEAVN